MRSRDRQRLRHILATAAVCVLGIAAQANAEQVQPYHYAGTSIFVTGDDAPDVALHEASGTLLTASKVTGPSTRIAKYDLAGASAQFEALGTSSFALPLLPTELNGSNPRLPIAVDNSGTSSDGNFYIASRDGSGRIFGYTEGGTPLPGFPITTPVAPCDLAVGPDGSVWVSFTEGGFYRQYTAGQTKGAIVFGSRDGGCYVDFDDEGNLYLSNGDRIARFDSSGKRLNDVAPGTPGVFPSFPSTPPFAADRASGNAYVLSQGSVNTVTEYEPSGEPVTAFGAPDPAHFSYPGLQKASDLAIDGGTHDVYVSVPGQVDVFARDTTPLTIPTVASGEADQLAGTSATLNGSLDGDGIDTTECRFEWGETGQYGNVASCSEGDVFAGDSGVHEVSATIGGLVKGKLYHFRLVAENANGIASLGRDVEFHASEPPILGDVSTDRITTDSARVRFEVNANGGPTTYRVEVGTDTSYGMSFPVPDAAPEALSSEKSILVTQSLVQELSGLAADTIYHYRVVAINAAGETVGPDLTFRTFPTPSSAPDPCPNSQARQQTGAAHVPDCRAYELVSAPDTGGYDVRSDLDGQVPLPAYPRATGQALYAMRSGTIPGIAGDPTNRGADPYVATRGPAGWSTRYVGLPATNPFAGGPFSSPLLGADAGLNVFAFGGDDICAPCFADGSTDVPLRLADGSLVEGMAGSLDPGAAEAAGHVATPFSADGSVFLFGSVAQFEPTANSNGSDVTLYARDLEQGTTEVISTLPSGETIQNGAGVAVLGVSEDGSGTVIGELVSTDSAGNPFYHLYLHLRGSAASVDLMPGAAGSGALFGGMTADGSRVYFTTDDPLPTASDQDTDTSADLYRADVAGSVATLTRLSTGTNGSGDTDECEPAPTSYGPHWNAVGAAASCGVTTVAGGGGVAGEEGSIFFLSPELLDGSNGVEDEPNLYVSIPGEDPRFVATLESQSTGAVPLPTRHSFVKAFGPFGVPQSLAVDQSAGYVYVLDVTAGTVWRFDLEGTPANFTDGPSAGTNALPGFTFPGGSSSGQVAVDNSGGPTDGTVYVTNNSAAAPVVRIFDRAGAPLGQLAGSSTPEGQFGGATGSVRYPSGVAVGPDGTLYVGGGVSGKVYRYLPSGSTVAESDYDATLNYGNGDSIPGQLSADSSGALYAIRLASNGFLANGGGASRFEASQFGAAGSQTGTLVDSAATSSYVDPLSDYLYVSRGATVAEYRPSGALHTVFGADQLTTSRGVAVLGSPGARESRIYASSASGDKDVSVFDTLPAPSLLVDNPLVTHSATSAASRHTEDLQVSPDGEFAVFASTLPLTGHDSERRAQIFRYGGQADHLECASCNSTGARPAGDTTLTPHGLNLADDGRVFFTTRDALALGDSNEKADAYMWSAGSQHLISTGTSYNDSSLLSVSADGVDAFFFTRESLAEGDENGSSIRLYTAREGGGFAVGPPTTQCAAADECRGPGTKAPVPAQVGTLGGRPGETAPAPRSRCGKGKVRRRGRCVKRQQRKRGTRRSQKAKRGGVG